MPARKIPPLAEVWVLMQRSSRLVAVVQAAGLDPVALAFKGIGRQDDTPPLLISVDSLPIYSHPLQP